MSRMALLAALGVAALLLCLGGLWLMRQSARSQRLASRLRRVQGLASARDEAAAGKGGESTPMRLIAKVGAAITRSGLLPQKTLAQLEETLVSSGLRASDALGLFVGAKVLLLALLPALAALLLPGLGLSGEPYIAGIAGAGIVGLLLPDYIIGKIRGQHLTKVELGVADALDMMVICAEAGLGLEPALSRVSFEIRHVHPALTTELDRTSGELQIIPDSRVALSNLGKRTGLDSLRRLGSTLIQTMQYGTPLSAALRVLSAELRRDTLTRFEERAARLPVMLTMPMILFILPCIFIIVGGPAVLNIINVMSSMK
jgi:tight adherence protein C